MDIDKLLRESAQKIDGCEAVSLVGTDGIALATHTRDSDADLTLADAQLATLSTTAENISKDIDAGEIYEIILVTEKMIIVVGFIGEDFYIYYALSGEKKNAGLARYEIKRLSSQLRGFLY